MRTNDTIPATARWRPWLSLAFGALFMAALWLANPEVMGWAWRNLPGGLGLTAAVAALVALPGLAAVRLLWRDHPFGRLELLALALGAGFALIPVLFELASFVGLPVGRGTALAYVAAAALALIGRPSRGRLRELARPSWSWPATLLSAIVAATAAVRLFIIKDLPVGMWGDSYHHTMMTQLLIDNRGLFSSWQPYAPLASFTYHFGFHGTAALIHWATGLGAAQSVLATGQIHSVASVVMAYGLASQLSGRPAAGVWAALLAGAYNLMPAYFVNWGRYTQLAGQVILPAALLCWLYLLSRPRLDWRHALLTTLLSLGLALTHYLVTALAIVFLLAYATARLIDRPSWATLKPMLIAGGAVGAAALALAVPWLINIGRGYWDNLAATTVAPPRPVAAPNLFPEQIVPKYLKGPIVALALAGTLLALARRDRRVALLALWTATMPLLVAPWLFRLPGNGAITYFMIYLALYVTATPLAGYALALGQESGWWARLRLGWLPPIGAALLVTAAAAWGVRWQSKLIDPSFQLFTPADERAMGWIRQNTPPDALFLVNAFPAYGEYVIAGDDGGWWIPLLTGRPSTLPPISYGTERAERPRYRQEINALNAELRAHPLPDPAGVAAIRAAGVDFIYSGPHAGSTQRFDLAALAGRPDLFRSVYERDGVAIFALEDAP